jgi:Zn-dependent protease with chaperone function
VKFDPGLPDDRVNVSRESPLREACVLLAGVVGAVAVFAVAVAFSVDLLVPLVPPRFEARVFGGDWVEALRADAAESDPRAAAVAALLDRMARHWPESPYRYRVALLDQAAPNAMAFPGGLVVVTTGLLDGVTSENELAFALGHELGHFRNRDHLRGLGRGLALALVTGGLGLSGAGGVAQLAALSASLADRGFGREQERRADAFGLALLQAEYGHVGGAADFFAHVPDPAPGSEATLAAWLSTHPLDDERMAALAALARQQGWPTTGARAAWAVP